MSYKNEVKQVIPGVLAVTLTQGQVALVDDAEDVREILTTYKFCVSRDHGERFDVISKSNGVKSYLHRLVLGCNIGPDDVVHHKDGNSLDCCRANLEYEPRKIGVWKRPNGYVAPYKEDGTGVQKYKIFKATRDRTMEEAKEAATEFVPRAENGFYESKTLKEIAELRQGADAIFAKWAEHPTPWSGWHPIGMTPDYLKK